MTKNAFITICGRPNVGKSSLINTLVGEKVAIVTNKPQTTRTKITGVVTDGDTQYVYIDTPGMHKPHTKLSEQMVKKVSDSVADVDLALFVVDVFTKAGTAEEDLVASFKQKRLPAICLINKTDALKQKDNLLEAIDFYSKFYDFETIIPISVHTGEGIDVLREEVKKYAEEGPHFFDEDSYTDQPERAIVAEIIREKILINMNDEIPHGTGVIIESMKERMGGGENPQPIMDISALIYCERKTHKGMLIGKNGTMLKKIGTQARLDMERFLDIKVNLECWIKVKEDWRNKEYNLKELGFNE